MMTIVDTVLSIGFWLHDWACRLLSKHAKLIKWLAHTVAWLSFGGLFFPELRKEFGSLGLDILLVIMFLSPVSRLFRMRLLFLLMGYRREMGILMGAWALIHSLGYLLDPVWLDYYITPYSPDIFGIQPRLLLGFLALFLTLPLWLTSNAWSQRLLKRNWVRLHWLAYPLLLAVLLHKFVSGDAGERDVIGFVAAMLLFGVYILARVLSRHNFLPPLRMLISFVAGRYHAYQADLKK